MMQQVMLSRREVFAALNGSFLAASAGVNTPTNPESDMGQNRPAHSASPAEYEAIIVGGSFAGLSAAMQLARARRRVLIIDAGRPRNRFAKRSHGFFGQDGRAPHEILETARHQVMTYPTVEFLRAEATHAVREKDRFLVHFGGHGEARAKRLVLATGVTDHLPEVPGMKELWGTGVAHCPYCHGYEFSGRRLAVFSVGKASVHQALLIRDWSEDVTLLTNGADGLTDEERGRLEARRVKIDETPVSRLIVKGSELAAVAFADGRRVPFGGMFTGPRCSLSSPLAEQLGCELEQGQCGPMVKTDGFKESTVPGVYVAGDAARAVHSATWASADGVTAGVYAHQSLLFPKQRS